MVRSFFANECQVADLNAAVPFKFCPPRSRYPVGILRLVLGAHLHNGEVRHIWPFLFCRQAIGVQQIVKFTHPVGSMGNANKDGRGHRNEGFNFP